MNTAKKKEASEREADEAWIETLGQERPAKYRRGLGGLVEEQPISAGPAVAMLRQNAEAPARETYSVTEAAKILKVSLVTVYRLIQRGKLRCLQSVRHKRIPRAELERFIGDDLG